jgi:hypothetical protein
MVESVNATRVERLTSPEFISPNFSFQMAQAMTPQIGFPTVPQIGIPAQPSVPVFSIPNSGVTALSGVNSRLAAKKGTANSFLKNNSVLSDSSSTIFLPLSALRQPRSNNTTKAPSINERLTNRLTGGDKYIAYHRKTKDQFPCKLYNKKKSTICKKKE